MSAAVDHDAISPSPAWEQGDEEVAGMSNGRQQITHEQINAELHELRGAVKARQEGDESRWTEVQSRLKAVEGMCSALSGDLKGVRATVETLKPAGVAQAIASVALGVIGLFERQPLALVIFGLVLLVWGAGGVAEVWQAIGK